MKALDSRERSAGGAMGRPMLVQMERRRSFGK